MYASLSLQDCGCRTTFCPHCQSGDFKRHGFFKRKDDARRIQRFYCKACQRTFSRAGFSLLYRHWHRRRNEMIRKLLSVGNTQRDIAYVLKIDKDTVARRLVILGKAARIRMLREREKAPLADCVQFDELISFEHTKMKPLSIAVISDADRWRILDVQVSTLPASGLLAKKAREKYGFRPDTSETGRTRMMARSVSSIHAKARVSTDKHAAYPALIKRFLPKATHIRHLGAKGAVVGQGELKQLGFDPLFCINHQFASHRAGLSRLARRTWCTTKNVERLKDHLMIYLDYYNRERRPKRAREFERYLAQASQIVKNMEANPA